MIYEVKLAVQIAASSLSKNFRSYEISNLQPKFEPLLKDRR